jgi:hypothetical protein
MRMRGPDGVNNSPKQVEVQWGNYFMLCRDTENQRSMDGTTTQLMKKLDAETR